MKYIVLFLKGIVIGIADAIPGVSGGTIAVITKIYDSLVEAITPNIKKLLKNMPFLIPVGLGMAMGLIAAAKLLGFLFETYNVPTQLLFLGVILGSIPMIYNECTAEKKLTLVDLIPFIIGTGIMIGMFFVKTDNLSEVSTDLTIQNGILFVVSAFLAAMAMIIPGISGALVMKILGAYDAAIIALNNLDFPVIILFVIGAIIGLFTTARIISFLLKKYRKATYCVIGGLIIGSVPSIFPFGQFEFNTQGIVGIILFVIGLTIPTLSELPSRNKKQKEVK